VTQGVEFWALNTDAQALENSQAPHKVQLGTDLTRGLGKSLPKFLQELHSYLLMFACTQKSKQLLFPKLFVLHAGTGGRPELGEQAAQESMEALAGTVTNADMVRPLSP
jgi:cell division protein FtsZ